MAGGKAFRVRYHQAIARMALRGRGSMNGRRCVGDASTGGI